MVSQLSPFPLTRQQFISQQPHFKEAKIRYKDEMYDLRTGKPVLVPSQKMNACADLIEL